MNRYGIGRPVVRRPCRYRVEATCKVQKDLWATDPEDAEIQFYDYTQSIESDYPEIVFEDISEIDEEA